MEVEFLVQPDRQVGELILQQVRAHGTPNNLTMVSAFAALTTVRNMKSTVEAVKLAGGAVRVVLGIDLKGTSKEVIEEVASWSVSFIVMKNRAFGVTFHPKIYFLEWPARADIIVGSNNLTNGGFYRNYEAATWLSYELPSDEKKLKRGKDELKRFLAPTEPIAYVVTPASLANLLASPLIPTEAEARRARAEGVPPKPSPRIFGYEVPKRAPVALPPVGAAGAGAPPSPPGAMAVPTAAAGRDCLAIQIRPQHNGEIYLSKRAVDQNPTFFGWPFTGKTTPKKATNAPYPQRVPDPVVDVTVYGADKEPVLTLSRFNLNTVFYSTKSEIRVTAAPLVSVTPDDSIMIMRPSEVSGVDYEIVIHRPDSPEYAEWLAVLDQQMPGGGGPPRRFGWL